MPSSEQHLVAPWTADAGAEEQLAGLRITSLLVNSMAVEQRLPVCNEYQTFMCMGICMQQSSPFHFSKFYLYGANNIFRFKAGTSSEQGNGTEEEKMEHGTETLGGTSLQS